ncbi:unnamed protein product [Lepeophtheirus salmonis]|uniref:(salmon louse) hypothetical protein n=1 Tax=Lepeophtheirus salmonis TaxID=72036 RepID=A0A7R8D370_LEPSM|nr:unnamed protein product [Lepeophtheirus salmonis]CAF3013420.1 unnamed protein product [Lepeophtheirus salmonis]
MLSGTGECQKGFKAEPLKLIRTHVAKTGVSDWTLRIAVKKSLLTCGDVFVNLAVASSSVINKLCLLPVCPGQGMTVQKGVYLVDYGEKIIKATKSNHMRCKLKYQRTFGDADQELIMKEYYAIKSNTSLPLKSPLNHPSVLLQKIRENIISFPCIESHYCRSTTQNKYLDRSISVPKMYSLYQEKMVLENLHAPKSDLCDKCTKFDDMSETSKTDAIKSEYKKHVDGMGEAANLRKQKLNCYNPTSVVARNKTEMLAVGVETTSGRSNEERSETICIECQSTKNLSNMRKSHLTTDPNQEAANEQNVIKRLIRFMNEADKVVMEKIPYNYVGR